MLVNFTAKLDVSAETMERGLQSAQPMNGGNVSVQALILSPFIVQAGSIPRSVRSASGRRA